MILYLYLISISRCLYAYYVYIILSCRRCQVRFTPLKVRTLNLTIWTTFLHLINFCLGLSSAAGFFNPGARVPTSAKCSSCFSVRSGGGGDAWFELVTVSFVSYIFSLLINRFHRYRWVALVSWLNYLILAIDLSGSFVQYLVKLTVDPTLDSSALLYIHHMLPMASAE